MSSPSRFSSFSLRCPFWPGVAVHDVGEGLLEALFVHPALGGGDVVRERVQAFVETGVPLQRDLDLAAVVLVADVDNRREQRLLRRVQVRYEVDDATVVLEDLLDRFGAALVAKHDLEALVQEGHLPQPLDQGLGAELDLFHDRGVGPEGDGGACLVGVAEPRQGGYGFTAVDEGHREATTVAFDLQLEPARQRVHDRHTDAVQAAGDLVALTAEFAAGVEHREHDLRGRLVGIFGVRLDRDSAAVVDDTAAAVSEQRDVDARRVARERLVD